MFHSLSDNPNYIQLLFPQVFSSSLMVFLLSHAPRLLSPFSRHNNLSNRHSLNLKHSQLLSLALKHFLKLLRSILLFSTLSL